MNDHHIYLSPWDTGGKVRQRTNAVSVARLHRAQSKLVLNGVADLRHGWRCGPQCLDGLQDRARQLGALRPLVMHELGQMGPRSRYSKLTQLHTDASDDGSRRIARRDALIQVAQHCLLRIKLLLPSTQPGEVGRAGKVCRKSGEGGKVK